MVITGYPYENGIHSEVIDLIDGDSICEDLANAPYQMNVGTGGLVNSKPLVCGGSYSGHLNKCFILGENKTINMAHERNHPSSVVINNKVSLSKCIKTNRPIYHQVVQPFSQIRVDNK